jgi:hypothetical protein
MRPESLYEGTPGAPLTSLPQQPQQVLQITGPLPQASPVPQLLNVGPGSDVPGTLLGELDPGP